MTSLTPKAGSGKFGLCPDVESTFVQVIWSGLGAALSVKASCENSARFTDVISDISQFPRVPYWLVEAALVRQWWDSGQLATTTKIPRSRALELLQTIR